MADQHDRLKEENAALRAQVQEQKPHAETNADLRSTMDNMAARLLLLHQDLDARGVGAEHDAQMGELYRIHTALKEAGTPPPGSDEEKERAAKRDRARKAAAKD